MRLTKKFWLTLTCAALLVVGTALGTLAYFTDSEAVTNTFTVGKVKITMDEAKVKLDGTADGASRVQKNEYHLIPGSTYTKDPTVHVQADSEDCWLFVRVENGLANIEAAVEGKGKIAEQIQTNGWESLKVKETAVPNVYYKKWVSADDVDQQVFSAFKINGGVDNATLAAHKDAKILVTAYAVQAAGFDTAADAWSATFGK